MRRPPRPTLFPYTTLFRSLPRRRLSRRLLDRAGADPMAEHAPHARDDPVLDELPDPHVRLGDDLEEPGAPEQHRSEEHTSELQSQSNLVCRLLLEKKNKRS